MTSADLTCLVVGLPIILIMAFYAMQYSKKVDESWDEFLAMDYKPRKKKKHKHKHKH